ncbi:MAG: hypothetical protein AAB303_07000 [Chloroflexota bacterium]
MFGTGANQKGRRLGNNPENVLARSPYQTPRRLSVADGPVRFNSVLVEFDDETHLARNIQRVDRVDRING